MDTLTKRRLLLSGIVGTLAVSPLIIRNFRRTEQLPEAEVATFPALRDPSVVPSGKVDVVNDFITFTPLTLPRKDIVSRTLNAVFSADNKWLLVSYCFGEDNQSCISYAPLDKFGLPETFVELKHFEPKSVIVGLGCSSINRRSGKVSYNLLQTETDTNSCSNALYCASLRHRGKRLECSPDSVMLMKHEYPIERWTVGGVGEQNHCWLDGQDAFISVKGSSLFKTNCGNVSGDRSQVLRPLVREGATGEEQHRISSNWFFDGRTIKFLEAPVRPWDPNAMMDPTITPYQTDPGQLVTLNLEGETQSEEPFPVPSRSRKTLITKTHCFFPSTGMQFFLTAALETPQVYFELRFSRDELVSPDSGIIYAFIPLAIFPSGKHLLCSREVGTAFIDEARKRQLPLRELGMIELPFKIG